MKPHDEKATIRSLGTISQQDAKYLFQDFLRTPTAIK